MDGTDELDFWPRADVMLETRTLPSATDQVHVKWRKVDSNKNVNDVGLVQVLIACQERVTHVASFSITSIAAGWLAAWHSGRTPVFDRRTFPVPRST